MIYIFINWLDEYILEIKFKNSYINKIMNLRIKIMYYLINSMLHLFLL